MSRLRVVVAGAGANIFPTHRRGFDAIGAEVVGVQDVDGERARRVGAELGCRVHADVTSLLAVEADLALILAPHPFHAELAIASLRAGKHVLVEKPIAVEIAEADRMVAEAELLGLTLAVCFQQRTRLEVREARSLVCDGFLGELQRADVLATWPRRGAYFQVAPWRGSWRGAGAAWRSTRGSTTSTCSVTWWGRRPG